MCVSFVCVLFAFVRTRVRVHFRASAHRKPRIVWDKEGLPTKLYCVCCLHLCVCLCASERTHVLVRVNECVRVHVDSCTSSSDETLINVQRLIISFPLQMHMGGPLSCVRCQGFPHGRKAFYWTRATLGAQNNAAIATVRGSDFGRKEREEGIGEGGGGWGKRRGWTGLLWKLVYIFWPSDLCLNKITICEWWWWWWWW